MTLEREVAKLRASMPDLAPRALGFAANAPSLDPAPFGVRMEFLDAARSSSWVDLYRRANALAFPPPLALPGWVLVDAYLATGAIAMLTCAARDLRPEARSRLGLRPDDDAIAAAYVALPCVEPGIVMGVSLFSHAARRGAATLVKALGLRMLHAKKQRGIAQLASPSLRVHTRMGDLRVVGRPPETHEAAPKSFVYEVDLFDEDAWARAIARRNGSNVVPTRLSDDAAIQSFLADAEETGDVFVVAPGLTEDGEAVYLRRGKTS